MSADPERERMVEETWRMILTRGLEKDFRFRHVLGLLPSNPRCRFCNAPFRGPGAMLVKLVYDKRRSRLNPNLCNVCETFADQYQGGAEIELTLLFADVRGSTTLAEGMSAADFSKLINRFYTAVTSVLTRTDALIDKLIGDQASGTYVPGFVGDDHARRGIEAAQEVIRVTGHGDADGPWIPLGAGVHTGVAFVGSVGSKDGALDITVLGDAANTAARLSSSAAVGEILISEAAGEAAGLNTEQMEKRVLELKGKSEPVTVHALSDTDKSRLAFRTGP